MTCQDEGVTGCYWVLLGFSWPRSSLAETKTTSRFYRVFLPGFTAKPPHFHFLSMTYRDEGVTGFYWVFFTARPRLSCVLPSFGMRWFFFRPSSSAMSAKVWRAIHREGRPHRRPFFFKKKGTTSWFRRLSTGLAPG